MPHAAVSPRQRGRAKQLRQDMTPAETLLWRHIKANRLDGLGFRRQVPIRNYIADFVCFALKLIVELDGVSHDFEAQQHADERRDAFFESQGFVVLRFTNGQVMSNLEGVVGAIRLAANNRSRSAPPSPTLPHKGGGSGKSAPHKQRGSGESLADEQRGSGKSAFENTRCQPASAESKAGNERAANLSLKAD